MPEYDSGVPNRWRVLKEVKRHFSLNAYEHVVVYSDFYSEAVSLGLEASRDQGNACEFSFPLEEAGLWVRGKEGSYVDLLSEECLAALERVCR
jgi:hypothetical protein